MLTTERLIYLPFDAHHIDTITSKAQTARVKTGEQKNKMTLSPKSLAGPGYIVLNGIRVLNVIGLLAVITASVVMLVKTSVASKLFFFDAVSHVLTAITSSMSCCMRQQATTANKP